MRKLLLASFVVNSVLNLRFMESSYSRLSWLPINKADTGRCLTSLLWFSLDFRIFTSLLPSSYSSASTLMFSVRLRFVESSAPTSPLKMKPAPNVSFDRSFKCWIKPSVVLIARNKGLGAK